MNLRTHLRPQNSNGQPKNTAYLYFLANMNSLNLIYKILHSIHFWSISSMFPQEKVLVDSLDNRFHRYVIQIGSSSIIYGAMKAPIQAAIDPIDVSIVLIGS